MIFCAMLSLLQSDYSDTCGFVLFPIRLLRIQRNECTLRELALPGKSTLYPTIQIDDNTLGTSYKAFSMYLKSQFVNFYRVACNLANCYVCESSN